MSEEMNSAYEEIISCEAVEEEGLIHIKIVALPYIDPVEFNIEEARQLSEKLNAAIRRIEGFYKCTEKNPKSFYFLPASNFLTSNCDPKARPTA